ncbi:MAG: sulfurtransferase [Candidatus Limnocylindria bacterium]
MTAYAHPEALVETDWLAEHSADPKVRVFEVDVDTAAFDQGHVGGAVGLNWRTDLQQHPVRDLITKEELEELLSRNGVTAETTIAIYGDNNNWFAAWFFWLLKYYGHSDVRLVNGGRAKWVAEGRPLVTDVKTYPRAQYRAKGVDASIRALRDYVLEKVVQTNGERIVDVRSPKEYTGELFAPENMPQEGAQRAGHIPGALNVPWSTAVADDGRFKSADELKTIYEGKGVTGGETIAYCRIGERSAHTWFVLKYLLGQQKVRNYDGSWTEWGSLIGVPIEK